ncbi:SulP family inorganic anion transporter [Pseudomonas aeruginosa]|uniref:Probable sulfate transporter n=1 Tax=Pseudomonas aeruginosa (strain ATCC 15692 / DSM 22644 / CIP 104116 / JCM 14847 / LMG 12228 / 1C / PRS 101 / PAO1) TaxID=208964 RepID=Q9I378_PSEAE|nr:SulP family inorganic anion transporter [Pseudomonas aeruginosa]NP_250338.1 sulfate transporter [Pseudomonas aeruginosa PAO1]AAG05036.1 probable sulfate transporter [Pseudomonas aeruginosa PAO1]AGV57817.1 putative sulfate transporter [Pseudomonas aeruginosa PAO581]AGY65902.1 putative sulfate transporter [Pseudomonas aeruginosa PAO1-VE2]AGY74180.1 putative sulfate transporter [Pseudomonas aeruginosa PAO1-VE13]AOP58802.1 sodium-independent anion transporter [Pseudomonas aeruginosa]
MPLARWVPGLDSLLHYRRAWFRPDVQAGLSVAAIQIPTAIAYAQIAGFPPQVGLYACILPMLIYALIGSSRQLMVGPDAATAAMVAAAITPLAAGDPQRLVDLSMIIAIMVGLFSIVAGLARAGFIASFLSRPILVGYLNGIGLSLLVGQLGKLFGYEAATSGFVAGILALLENLLHIHWPTLILGSLSLLLMVLLPRRFPQLPGALCGVLLASLAAALLGLDRYGVELLGEVPAGLPQLSWPQTSLEELKSLLRDATGITVVSFCSAMLTARSFAARHGYSINANHEFVALGLANIGAGVSQGFAISGADSRTAVNDMVGGKTQLVGVVAALVIAATLLLLNKPLGWVPMPALGAVLLLAGWGLIDVQALKGFWKLSRFEFSLCLLTTVGVLSVGVLPGIFVAVSIAVLRLLYYTYRPSDAVLGWMHGIDGQVELAKYPQATTLPGLVIYRFDAPLLFFNADYFKQRVLAVVDGSERPNAVLLNAEAMTNLDISGLATLHEVQQILKAQGVHLSLARVTGQTLDLLQRSSMLGEIKPPLVFSSVRSGVSAYRYWLRQQERLAAQAAATSGNA